MSTSPAAVAWRETHRRERAAYQLAWRAANRAKTRATDRARRRANPEANRAKVGAYQRANAERVAARQRVWRAANPDKVRAYNLARKHIWREAFPERAREASRRNSARRRGAETCTHASCLVVGAAQLAWQTNEHLCYLCRAPVWDGVNLHMDHVIPIALGGAHCADNLRPACATCNTRKGARVAV